MLLSLHRYGRCLLNGRHNLNLLGSPIFRSIIIASSPNLLAILSKDVHIRPDLRPRADETHLPSQHIDQLRELIDLGLAQDSPQPGDPGVGAERDRFPFVGNIPHQRAKFVDAKVAKSLPNALLPAEDGMWRVQHDQEGHYQEQGDRGGQTPGGQRQHRRCACSPAVLFDQRPDRVDDALDIGFAQLGIDRERNDALEHRAGGGKILRAVSEGIAVIGVEMEGDEMDARPDVFLLE
jgi:hypothetical protein